MLLRVQPMEICQQVISKEKHLGAPDNDLAAPPTSKLFTLCNHGLIMTQQGVADMEKKIPKHSAKNQKIPQAQVHISWSGTHKPANDGAKFKQSTQCCSQ